MFIENISAYIPKNEYSIFVKEYFIGIKRYGTKKYITNIDVEINFIEIDEYLIPLTFGNKKCNCYTTSLLGSLNYLIFELKNINNIFLRYIYMIFLSIFKLFGDMLYVDNIIYVNNLMLSTNIYPDFKNTTIHKINIFLKNNFKDKVIIYRSLNNYCNKNIITQLENDGFYNLVSRQIFIFNSSLIGKYKKIKVVKNDFRIIKKFGFELKKINLEDSSIVLSLYNKLYIKKYTKLNPTFSKYFIEDLIKNKNFYFYKLLDSNKVVGIIGYYVLNNQATTPIFGYEIDYAKNYNLYSQISNLLTFNGLQKVDILNSSSGAGKFKVARGGKQYIEYSYIYLPKNIGFGKKIFFSILFYLGNKVIEKELKNNLF